MVVLVRRWQTLLPHNARGGPANDRWFMGELHRSGDIPRIRGELLALAHIAVQPMGARLEAR